MDRIWKERKEEDGFLGQGKGKSKDTEVVLLIGPQSACPTQ